jgi:predicted RNA-binding Zn-ribbon protein involved in translation (DUF1610 family)
MEINKMTEILTCPYCNASLNLQAGWAAGQRITCPRCGDAFVLRCGDARLTSPSPAQPVETVGAAEAPAPAVLPRWSNRLVAGVILGLMLFMAGNGLIFMLLTQEQRRAYDTSRPPRRPGKQRGFPEENNVPSLASVAPDKWAALGYLPSGVHFLFAARVPELLAGSAGAQVLRTPVQLGEASFRLENVPKWLGFALEEIDHVLFAVRLDDAVLPPFYVVLRTTEPYDPESLRRRLKCTHVLSPSKKQLYAFRALQQDIQLHACFADERTVVLALFADQLEALPSSPVADLQQLPEELRTLLQQRREPAAPLWIAGHSRDWSKTSAATFLKQMKKEELEKIASLHTFGVFFIPMLDAPADVERERGNEKEKKLIVKGIFACKDASGARRLEDYFRTLGGADADFKTVLDGAWLTLQFQTRPDFLAHLLMR